MQRATIAALLLATAVFVGCDSASKDRAETSTESGGGGPQQEGGGGNDDDAMLACSHFRNIASDYSAGLLTESELRTKLQEVYENSVIAGSAVRSAAKDMLAGSTAGDDTALADAVDRMGEACVAAGQ